MELLIDTNIILDVVLNRAGCNNALRLFQTAQTMGDCAYITASSVTDLFFIIHKSTHSKDATYKALHYILSLVRVLPVAEQDILDAISREWRDFEDCVQYTTALRNGIDLIVTNNISDFKEFGVPAVPPEEYVRLRSRGAPRLWYDSLLPCFRIATPILPRPPVRTGRPPRPPATSPRPGSRRP